MGHALNNTALQFAAAHSTVVEAAAFGFMPGLILGLRKQ